MSDRMIECPDVDAVLAGLKDFQRDSVDYVFRRMYLDRQPARRFLIADEVGLGKTIEAGLIWTELEARKNANRVLIVSPSALVPKWRQEMDSRFNFELIELDGKSLPDFEEKILTGRLPKRGAYIGSLNKLRQWDSLKDFVGLLKFDLEVGQERTG